MMQASQEAYYRRKVFGKGLAPFLIMLKKRN